MCWRNEATGKEDFLCEPLSIACSNVRARAYTHTYVRCVFACERALMHVAFTRHECLHTSAKSSTQGNQRPQLTVLSTADFRERSKFIMEDGKWLYQGGDVNFDPQVACLSHSRRMA